MKRRKFAQSVMAAVGVASLPMGVSIAAHSPAHALNTSENIITDDGLKLKLKQKTHPTKNKDSKQFILTYDVENSMSPLVERTYDLKLASGNKHQVFMTPVGENQLQAVFNLRLNA